MKAPLDPKYLTGKNVRIRDVEISDAEFILALRCDPVKSAHLHKTENDLQKQIDYLKRYKTLDNEWYFIIEDLSSRPLGTARIYDVREDSYGSGSWLLVDGVDMFAAVESDYLVKNYAFTVLGFEQGHYDVRKENKQVVQYHKSLGAQIVAEDELHYFYICKRDIFLPKIKRLLHIQ